MMRQFIASVASIAALLDAIPRTHERAVSGREEADKGL
jgi:hypothetical protein